MKEEILPQEQNREGRQRDQRQQGKNLSQDCCCRVECQTMAVFPREKIEMEDCTTGEFAREKTPTPVEDCRTAGFLLGRNQTGNYRMVDCRTAEFLPEKNRTSWEESRTAAFARE